MQSFVKELVAAKIRCACELRTVNSLEECVELVIKHTKIPRSLVVERLSTKYPVFKILPTNRKGGI